MYTYTHTYTLTCANAQSHNICIYKTADSVYMNRYHTHFWQRQVLTNSRASITELPTKAALHLLKIDQSNTYNTVKTSTKLYMWLFVDRSTRSDFLLATKVSQIDHRFFFEEENVSIQLKITLTTLSLDIIK